MVKKHNLLAIVFLRPLSRLLELSAARNHGYG